MSQPSYFAIITADVRYDDALVPNAKLLYGEISALCSIEGFCWAENAYFAKLYGVTTSQISRWISQLASAGYINVEINKSAGNSRKITIDQKVIRSRQKTQEVLRKSARGIAQKRKSIKENNTINNTINISADTPFEFLEKNHLSKLEASLMKFKSRMPDFEKFKEYYNLRVVKDGTPWDAPRLIASMELIANTWLENLAKGQNNNAAPAPVANNPSGTKITYNKRS